MIKRTYKANTNISINVVLPNKNNLRISFTPLSDGSSTFTTDNEEIMKAIESHYNFGKLFRLLSQHGESEKNTHTIRKEKREKLSSEDNTHKDEDIDTEIDSNNDYGETNNSENYTNEGETEGAGLKEVYVTDYPSAKDYLADTFGVSRTTLRSPKAILEQAKANGIRFVGLS